MNVFQLVPLLDEVLLTHKLETIDYFDGQLFVGTKNGLLLRYSISRSTAPEEMANSARLLCEHSIGKKPIEMIRSLADFRQLLVMSEGNLTVHSMDTLEQVSATAVLRGISLFCLNETSSRCLLCVSIKRKLIFYAYSPTEFQLIRELPFPDTALSMAWSGHVLCVGTKKEYMLVHDETADARSLPIPLDKFPPCVKLIHGGEFLLMGQESVGIFVKSDGFPSAKSTLSWSKRPVDVAIQGSYVIGLLSNHTVEIFNMRDQKVIQTVAFSQGKTLTDQDNRVFLASIHAVSCLSLIPFEQHMKKLLQGRRISEALDLLNHSVEPTDDNKPRMLRNFQKDAGWALFEDLKFAEAVSYFNNSDLEPLEMLSFYPDLILEHLLDQRFAQLPTRPNIRQFVASKLADITEEEPSSQAESLDDRINDRVQQARRSLIDFLENRRQRLSTASRAARDMSPASNRASQFEVEPAVLKRIIDSALLKLYVEFEHSGLSALLDSHPDFRLEDVETFLTERRKLTILARVSHLFGEDRRALELWRRIGTEEARSSTQSIQAAEESLAILLAKNDSSLIWEFSDWMLKIHPAIGCRIFTGQPRIDSSSVHPTDNRSKNRRNNPSPIPNGSVTPRANLPAHDVLKHLLKYEQPSEPLVEHYLEHLINDTNNMEESLHTQLALRYLETVLTLRPRTAPVTSATAPGSEPGMLGVYRRKLLDFLQRSNSYHSSSVLEKVKGSWLTDEAIILYGKLQRHREALELLVENRSSDESVENYCSLYGDADNPLLLTLLQIYLSKLKPITVEKTTAATTITATTPPKEKEKEKENTKQSVDYNHDRIISLLNRYPNHPQLQPLRVLEVLPKDWSVSDVSGYITRVMRSQLHQCRQAQVERQLFKMDHLQVQCQHVSARNRYVAITPSKACSICNRRIDDMVFVAYPNNTVVHYNCTENLQVCPVTGVRFDDAFLHG
eukprot:GILJ01006266.1.p1 GENE.GILJ01006266.1~~GILJ01006266.1.p1  ORF type:complete len:957 (-),score=149.06 GILJ01006266.1:255-3125(-)